MRRFKRTLAVLLIVCSILSVTSCGEKQPADTGMDICSEFCKDVYSGDATKLIAYFNGDSISTDEISEIICPSDRNIAQQEYLNTVKKAISYTIQEPIYDSDTKQSTAYLNWHIPDLEDAAVKSAATLEDLETALYAAPQKIITTYATVDLSGDTPKITNGMDIIKAVYEFASGDYGVMPGTISDFYSSGDWMLAPRDVYINTDKICLMVNFKPELFDYRFVPGIKYVVSRGEEELFASDVIYLIEASTKLDFTAKNNKSSFNENGNLIDGTYEIRIEDEYGNEIKSYKCKVETKTYEKEEIVFKNNKNDYYLTNLVYEIKDDDLKSLSYPTKTGWWDYDVTSVGKSAFASNTKTLAFSLSVNADIERELYYDYYYSKTSDFKDINKATPVYSGSCKPSAYDDQSCYDLDYTSEKFEPGFYGLVVYSDASKTHIVLTAACIVVKETSQSVTGNN